jgi:heme/copper-type cytochrome/quinol oxidase subunit 2
VGAAVAVGGGVLGTLIPQVEATIVSNVLVLIGVIGTLAYFHFGATQKADGSVRRNILVNALTWVGRIYIAITFGVLFAGVYMAALTALIERMDSIRSFIFLLMQ